MPPNQSVGLAVATGLTDFGELGELGAKEAAKPVRDRCRTYFF